MAESRDRLQRPIDLAEVFAQRLATGILSDESQRLLRGTGVGVIRTIDRGFSRSSLAIARSGRNLYQSPLIGRENLPVQGRARRGRRRDRGSVLPSWYPRAPLRDITFVVRAIGRRRARLGDDEGQGTESSTHYEQNQRAPSSDFLHSSAQLEHEFCTPASTSRKKPCPPPSMLKVSKILHDASNQSPGDSKHLTPQRKLLNSLDTVEKIVMEELQNLAKTPGAKKAERVKKVRTLLSMR